MPVGLFSGAEFVILGVIVLIFFGYKWLPRLGRSAGEGTKRLGEGAKRHAATAQAYVDEHTPDAGEVGRTAGRHVREYRELKDTVMGTTKPEDEERPARPPEVRGHPTTKPSDPPTADGTDRPVADVAAPTSDDETERNRS